MSDLKEAAPAIARFHAPLHEESLRKKTSGSRQRYERSRRSLAGGVSSGLRRAAKPYPLFFDHGEGALVADVDGNKYWDYGLAWGPLILGQPAMERNSFREFNLARAPA